MNELEILNSKISDTEMYLDTLRERRDRLLAERDEQNAYKNSYEAMFDGIKLVADRDNPIPLKFPMHVKPNLFYVSDGTVYVGLENGIVTENNFRDMLEPDELNELEE